MQSGGGAVTKIDAALVNLRARALDLHARLAELRDAAAMLRDGVGMGRNEAWPTFLNKYDTLAKLFYQLTEELDRSLTEVGLENFVAQPKSVTTDPTLVPELLRTKLEPEIERDFENLQKDHATDTSDKDVAVRISSFNAFIEAALDQFQDLRDDLAKPRPQEPPGKIVPPAADAILDAITSGAGLRPM